MAHMNVFVAFAAAADFRSLIGRKYFYIAANTTYLVEVVSSCKKMVITRSNEDILVLVDHDRSSYK